MNPAAESESVFRKRPLAARLCQIATCVSKISELARDASSSRAVAALLDSTRNLIEWTAPEIEAAPEAGGELANLLRTLTMWLGIWREEQVTRRLQTLLYHEMRCWSERVSGFAERMTSLSTTAVR